MNEIAKANDPFPRCIFLILLMLTLSAGAVAGNVMDINTVMTELVGEIDRQSKYTAAKEARIRSLKDALAESRSMMASYRLAKDIFSEYIFYQSDSAYHYASVMRNLSETLGDASLFAESNFALMKCFSSNGYFKEAADMDKLVVVDSLPSEALADYYRTCTSYYQNLESYAGGAHTDLGRIYRDKRMEVAQKLAETADSNSYLWHQNRIGLEQMENPSLDKEISDRLALLKRFDLNNHEQAIQHSLLGHAYIGKGNREEAKRHLALSAINDIRGSVTETTAAKMLAEMMYEDKDLALAHQLIHQAFDDASFYNSHLRRDELSKTMQMIDSARYAWRSNQLWWVVGILSGFVLLLASVMVLFVKVRHRNREIENVNAELHRKSDALDASRKALSETNKELESTIAQLREVSEIKDSYITQSLYVNTVFVNEVEERLKNAMKLLKEKKYDELKFLPYQMGIKEERQRIFRNFDDAFIKLFPNFIDEFNRLFKEEDWIELNDSGELPMDVRVFALLRLGISDPAEVAKYLNLSVKTIYVYKTKLKSKSILANDDFEAAIKAIPKP